MRFIRAAPAIVINRVAAAALERSELGISAEALTLVLSQRERRETQTAHHLHSLPLGETDPA